MAPIMGTCTGQMKEIDQGVSCSKVVPLCIQKDSPGSKQLGRRGSLVLNISSYCVTDIYLPEVVQYGARS